MSGTYVIWPPPASGSGGGGGPATTIAFSIGSMDGQAASVNGASVSSSSIFMQSASSTSPGLVNTVAQAFAGVKTFVSSPIISQLAGSAPVFTNATGALVSGSVSLTTQVVGVLPLANTSTIPIQPTGQTSGSISLTAQVSGVLPLANTSVIPIQSGGQTSGSVSLTNQVVGNLPVSQTSGSISLTNQVAGVLPQANVASTSLVLGINTFGSLSASQVTFAALSPNAQLATNAQGQAVVSSVNLSSQVTGNLPLTQVSGILPQANLTLTPTFTQATLGSVSVTSSAGGAAYTVKLPGAQGASSTFLQNDGSGNLSWGAAPNAVTGSVSQTSSTGGSAYTISWPGTQSFGYLANNGAGNLYWAPGGSSVSTATAQYAIGSTDELILCSSASFNVLVPTAAGQSGRMVTIQHTGISLTQLYALNTVSSQTIGGVVGAGYVLYTNNEALTIVSDGSNWQILNHKADTAWTSYSPAISGFGNVASATFSWKRSSSNMFISGGWVNGTVNGSTSSFSLPGSMIIGSNLAAFSSSREYPVGFASTDTGGASGKTILALSGNTVLHVSLIQNAGAGGLSPQAGTVAGGSGEQNAFANIMVPISGWQP